MCRPSGAQNIRLLRSVGSRPRLTNAAPSGLPSQTAKPCFNFETAWQHSSHFQNRLGLATLFLAVLKFNWAYRHPFLADYLFCKLSIPCLMPASNCTMPQKSENRMNSPRPIIMYIAFSSDKLSIVKITRAMILNTNMIVAYVYQPLRSTYLAFGLFGLFPEETAVLCNGVPQKGHFSN